MDYQQAQIAKFQELRRNTRRISQLPGAQQISQLGIPGSSSADHDLLRSGSGSDTSTSLSTFGGRRASYNVPMTSKLSEEDEEEDETDVQEISGSSKRSLHTGILSTSASARSHKRDSGRTVDHEQSKQATFAPEVSSGNTGSGSTGRKGSVFNLLQLPNSNNNQESAQTRQSVLIDAATMEFLANATSKNDGYDACKDDGVLHPDSYFRGFLQLVLCMFAYYSAILVPWQLSFLIHSGEPAAFFWVDAIADTLYFVDVLLNLVTAYRPDFKDLAEATEEEVDLFLVTERGRVFSHAVRNLHKEIPLALPLLDVWVLLIYFGHVPLPLKPEHLRSLIILRIFRLISRLGRAYQLKQLGNATTFAKEIMDRAMRSSAGATNAILTCAWLLVPIHWATCLFYAVTSCDLNEHEGQSMCYFGHEVQFVSEVAECGTTGRYCPMRSYGVSLFVILTLFNGDGHPMQYYTSQAELVVCIISAVLGAVVLGLIFGEVASALAKHNIDKKKHLQRINAIGENLKELHLDDDIRRKVIDYFDVRFDMYRLQTTCKSIISDLNDSLRGTMELYLHSEVVSEFPILADLLEQSRLIAVSLVSALHMQTYMTGDVVCTRHTLSNWLGILLFGTVQRAGKYIKFMSGQICDGPDMLFGRTLLIPKGAYAHTCVASEISEMYELRKSDYDALCDQYNFPCCHHDALRNFESELEAFLNNRERTVGNDVMTESEVEAEYEKAKEAEDSDDDDDDEIQTAIFRTATQAPTNRPNFGRSKTKPLAFGGGIEHRSSTEDDTEHRGSISSKRSSIDSDAVSSSSEEEADPETVSLQDDPDVPPNIEEDESRESSKAENKEPAKSAGKDPVRFSIDSDELPPVSSKSWHSAGSSSGSKVAQRNSTGTSSGSKVAERNSTGTSSGSNRQSGQRSSAEEKPLFQPMMGKSMTDAKAKRGAKRLHHQGSGGHLPMQNHASHLSVNTHESMKDKNSLQNRKSLGGTANKRTAGSFLTSLFNRNDKEADQQRETAERKVQEVMASRLERKRLTQLNQAAPKTALTGSTSSHGAHRQSLHSSTRSEGRRRSSGKRGLRFSIDAEGSTPSCGPSGSSSTVEQPALEASQSSGVKGDLSTGRGEMGAVTVELESALGRLHNMIHHIKVQKDPQESQKEQPASRSSQGSGKDEGSSARSEGSPVRPQEEQTNWQEV